VAAIDERARGGGAAGWWPCGGCSAREASAEATISESEKRRRRPSRLLGDDEQGEDGEGVERVRQRLETRGASPAVLHSRPLSSTTGAEGRAHRGLRSLGLCRPSEPKHGPKASTGSLNSYTGLVSPSLPRRELRGSLQAMEGETSAPAQPPPPPPPPDAEGEDESTCRDVFVEFMTK
jgi:hypothetical protein